MAFLADRVDGTSQGTMNANWYNDSKYALTGLMTDQPFTMYYAPASGGGPAVLTIKTNGNAHALHVQNSTGTQLFDVDATGNVTIDNEILWQTTLAAATRISSISTRLIRALSPTNWSTTRATTTYSSGTAVARSMSLMLALLARSPSRAR